LWWSRLLPAVPLGASVILTSSSRELSGSGGDIITMIMQE
jgi:hypothetical protein